MTVKIEYNGKTFEFRGEYRVPVSGDYWLSNDPSNQDGNILEGRFNEPRTILHLVPEILEFGGVKFEKTGEVRAPKKGEWYLSNDYLERTSFLNRGEFSTDAEILKPYSAAGNEQIWSMGHAMANNLCSYCINRNLLQEKKDRIVLKFSTVKLIADFGYVPQVGAIESEIVDACKESLHHEPPPEHKCIPYSCRCTMNR